MRCRSPRCYDDAAEGDKWCQYHGALLRRVRAELDAGKEQRLRSGSFARKWPKLYDPVDDTYRDIRDTSVT